MSLKNTATVDKIKPIPRVNMNKHIYEKGNIKWYQLIPVPVKINTRYSGISVNKKFIPTNKHLLSGNIYFGI